MTTSLDEDITAALTLTKTNQILLFFGSKYCSFNYDPEITEQLQTCQFGEVSDFFNCESVKQTDICGQSSVSSVKIGDGQTQILQKTQKPSPAVQAGQYSGQTEPYKKSTPSVKSVDPTEAKSSSVMPFAGKLVFYLILISLFQTLCSNDLLVIKTFYNF